MEAGLLEVNDIIYVENMGMKKCTIDRVTDKYAFSKGEKFHREYNKDGDIKSITCSEWDTTIIQKENDEVKHRYIRKVVENKLNKTDWTKLSDDIVLEVYRIVKNSQMTNKGE